MENRYINRYRTFCRSLKNLEKSKSADPKADFVLEGTVLNFNVTVHRQYPARCFHAFMHGNPETVNARNYAYCIISVHRGACY